MTGEARVLWLVYGEAGDPKGVRYPADREDVEFVRGLLQRPRMEREEISLALGNYLAHEEERSAWLRRAVPVRGESGLYRLIPWRLAKWLKRGLLAEGRGRDKIFRKFRKWLGQQGDGATEGRVFRVET